MMKKIGANSLIIMGKSGIGKTYLLKLLARELSKTCKVIHFDEPPTAKTILLNLLIAADSKSGSNSDESIRNLEGYQGERIILCIDKLENMTPSAIQVIDRLFGFSWFRFIGAGHLWSKRRFNSTWKKAKGMMLHYLSRHEATRLLDYHWKEGDSRSKRTIIDEARGIPGQIVRMASEAKQGIMPKSEQKYLDATPFVLVIATIGLAVRVIGYGYQSTETYIMGGIIASVFWGLFWIYRGYVAGWWGTKSQLSRKHR
jgi:energy-coupling factor transporter ATP-binding protein EcfA2